MEVLITRSSHHFQNKNCDYILNPTISPRPGLKYQVFWCLQEQQSNFSIILFNSYFSPSHHSKLKTYCLRSIPKTFTSHQPLTQVISHKLQNTNTSFHFAFTHNSLYVYHCSGIHISPLICTIQHLSTINTATQGSKLLRPDGDNYIFIGSKWGARWLEDSKYMSKAKAGNYRSI